MTIYIYIYIIIIVWLDINKIEKEYVKMKTKRAILTVLTSLTIIIVLSGSAIAGTVTNSMSFRFHNINNFIGNTGADSAVVCVSGLRNVSRTFSSSVTIQDANYNYAGYTTCAPTITTDRSRLNQDLSYVGVHSSSDDNRKSKHKVYMSDGVAGITCSAVGELCNSTYSATQKITF